MAVMLYPPAVRERIGGREAAFQVGTMLVASAATMLTPIEIAAPSISPSTDTPRRRQTDCA